MNFLIIWGFSRENAHICTQISLIVPNIQNPHRDTTEILKLHELGTRLLSNPNKYGTDYYFQVPNP